MKHRYILRVYYEDTDMAGIVYYANYLKFIERGRSEWLRSLGIDQAVLKQTAGKFFVVRRLEAEFYRPACFDNVLTVETELAGMSGAKIILDQRVLRGEQLMFSAGVTIVCMNSHSGPTRIPQEVVAALTARS